MSGTLLLDLVLGLLLLSFAAAGWQRGLLGTVAALVGFLVGAWVVVWAVPGQLESLLPRASTGMRALLLVALAVAAGGIGLRLAERLVTPLSTRARRSAAGGLDAAVGAVVTVAVAAVTMWFVGGVLRSSGPSIVAAPAANSRVLSSLNAIIPARSDRFLAGVINGLDSAGFPRVFDSAAAETMTAVDAPDTRVRGSAGVKAASRSVLRIDSMAVACQESMEGSGWVMGKGLVVTNAHVVAGAERVRVVQGGRRIAARVVAFDPSRDIAVLAVPGLDAPPLPMGEPLRSGASAVIAGYPLAGPYRVDPARVRQVIDALGKDIYGLAQVQREVYSLRASISPGNSGGPVLDPAGRVIGVVFARSLDDPSTAYALTLDEIDPVLRSVRPGRQAVGTGECVSR